MAGSKSDIGYLDSYRTDRIDEKIKNSFNNTSNMLNKAYSLSMPDLTKLKPKPARSYNELGMIEALDFHTYLKQPDIVGLPDTVGHPDEHRASKYHHFPYQREKIKTNLEQLNQLGSKSTEDVSQSLPENKNCQPEEYSHNTFLNEMRYKRLRNLQNIIDGNQQQPLDQSPPLKSDEQNVHDWLVAKNDWCKTVGGSGNVGLVALKSPRTKAISIADEYKRLQTENKQQKEYNHVQSLYTTHSTSNLHEKYPRDEPTGIYETNQRYLANLLGEKQQKKPLLNRDSQESFQFNIPEKSIGKSNSDDPGPSPLPRPESGALSEPITPTYQQKSNVPHPHADLHRPYRYNSNLHPHPSNKKVTAAEPEIKKGDIEDEKPREDKEGGGEKFETLDANCKNQTVQERTEDIIKRVDDMINQRKNPSQQKENDKKQQQGPTYNEIHSKRRDLIKISARRVKRKQKPVVKEETENAKSKNEQNEKKSENDGFRCQCSDEEQVADVDAKESADYSPPKPLWYDNLRYGSQYPVLKNSLHDQSKYGYLRAYPLTAEEVYRNAGVDLQEQEYYLDNRGKNLHGRYDDSPLAQKYFSGAGRVKSFPPISPPANNSGSPKNEITDDSKDKQRNGQPENLAFKGVDVESDDYIAKKTKMMRQREYAELLRQHQREMPKDKPQVRSWRNPDTLEKESQESKRFAALNFAKTVPKPPVKKSSSLPQPPNEREELVDAIEVMKRRHFEEKQAIEQMRAQIQQQMAQVGY